MNKFVYIKVFNDILDNFFDYLKDNFVYFRSDIILTQSTINLIRNGNSRLVVEKFMIYVEPYSKKIYDCDEDFFLKFENNLNLKNDNILYGMKLKNIWLSNETTEIQKATIFLYFHKLLKTGEKCIEM